MVLWVEFFLIALLVLILAVSSFAFGRGAARRRQREAEAAVDGEMAERLAASQAEVAELRSRLEVLEKLAVDPETRLSDDIERLRRGPGASPGRQPPA